MIFLLLTETEEIKTGSHFNFVTFCYLVEVKGQRGIYQDGTSIFCVFGSILSARFLLLMV